MARQDRARCQASVYMMQLAFGNPAADELLKLLKEKVQWADKQQPVEPPLVQAVRPGDEGSHGASPREPAIHDARCHPPPRRRSLIPVRSAPVMHRPMVHPRNASIARALCDPDYIARA